jgi:hypothetical protein
MSPKSKVQSPGPKVICYFSDLIVSSRQVEGVEEIESWRISPKSKVQGYFFLTTHNKEHSHGKGKKV